jgi:hypothetical protein
MSKRTGADWWEAGTIRLSSYRVGGTYSVCGFAIARLVRCFIFVS